MIESIMPARPDLIGLIASNLAAADGEASAS